MIQPIDLRNVSEGLVGLLETHCPYESTNDAYAAWFAIVRLLSNVLAIQFSPPITDAFLEPLTELAGYVADSTGVDHDHFSKTVADGAREIKQMLDNIQ